MNKVRFHGDAFFGYDKEYYEKENNVVITYIEGSLYEVCGTKKDVDAFLADAYRHIIIKDK